eukprot:gene39816-49204_t
MKVQVMVVNDTGLSVEYEWVWMQNKPNEIQPNCVNLDSMHKLGQSLIHTREIESMAEHGFTSEMMRGGNGEEKSQQEYGHAFDTSGHDFGPLPTPPFSGRGGAQNEKDKATQMLKMTMMDMTDDQQMQHSNRAVYQQFAIHP